MIKIAVLGGRPMDGTPLPKSEREVWKEMKRVLVEQIEYLSPVLKQAELCFPIYSKFDIEFLREAKEFHRPTTFYVPSQDWGLSKLPPHQTRLISSIQANRVVEPHALGRIERMIHDSDLVYFFDNGVGTYDFYPLLKNKKVIQFPVDKMRYRNDEEYALYQQKQEEDNKNNYSEEEINTRIESFFEKVH